MIPAINFSIPGLWLYRARVPVIFHEQAWKYGDLILSNESQGLICKLPENILFTHLLPDGLSKMHLFWMVFKEISSMAEQWALFVRKIWPALLQHFPFFLILVSVGPQRKSINIWHAIVDLGSVMKETM